MRASRSVYTGERVDGDAAVVQSRGRHPKGSQIETSTASQTAAAGPVYTWTRRRERCQTTRPVQRIIHAAPSPTSSVAPQKAGLLAPRF